MRAKQSLNFENNYVTEKLIFLHDAQGLCWLVQELLLYWSTYSGTVVIDHYLEN